MQGQENTTPYGGQSSENAAGAEVWWSLWICPARSSRSFAIARDIINTAKPIFDPHVTIFSMTLTDVRSQLGDMVEKLREFASAEKKFRVSFSESEVGATRFRSVYLKAKKEESLLGFQQRCAEKLGYISMVKDYMPHLSLLYTEDAEERSIFHKKLLNDNIHEKLNQFEFDVESIELYTTEGPVENWTPVGSFPLGTRYFLPSSLYIGGEFVRPSSNEWLEVINPASKSILHWCPAGGKKDINDAVEHAKKAASSWGTLSAGQRSVYLKKMADKLIERKKDLATLEVLDNGKPLKEALADVDDSANCLRYYADKAIKFQDEENNKEIKLADHSYTCQVSYEPVGVCGLITPWNYPLLMAVWKVAPCLAAGSVAVLKPSEITPLSALEFGRICFEIGLPAGVLNIVTGTGPSAGAPLSNHSDVAKVSFTGSTLTGGKIMQAASSDIKQISLELGGKSPLVVFDDVDIEQAVNWIMFGIFANSGQICSANSRLILSSKISDQVLSKLAEKVKQLIKIGNGLDERNNMGPLVSELQYNKVISYIQAGVEQGGMIILGGNPTGDLLEGYFIPPTIFVDVSTTSTIWKEEIFGPVLVVRTFETEEEAIQLANDTPYGLAGGVMSKDKKRCEAVAKQIKAGIVWINCSQPMLVEAPWGGMKCSGIGREGGQWGLLNYMEAKQTVVFKGDTWSWY